MAVQMTFNTFLQEDAADNVLPYLSAREKYQLASVCRVWRAWVAASSSTISLCGIDVQEQLTWLVQRVLPRTLKVTAPQSTLAP